MPVLASFIEESLRASESWRSLLDGDGALYLLGRGPALASVYEAALLFHETAKAPAVGMSSGQFRHGPVEVVSPTFRAVIFGTPPTTRAKDRSLAEDLLQMGATVRWIGPSASLGEDPRAAVEPLVAWPEFGPEFGPVFAPVLAPLFEIVPMQVAAYQLALWHEITPGDFRFASEVTSAESGFPLLQAKRSPHP
jgi:glucosamine--fructose-6-phosphate aminotransferase (isomerizing)